jgi:hypothetical protein
MNFAFGVLHVDGAPEDGLPAVLMRRPGFDCIAGARSDSGGFDRPAAGTRASDERGYGLATRRTSLTDRVGRRASRERADVHHGWTFPSEPNKIGFGAQEANETALPLLETLVRNGADVLVHPIRVLPVFVHDVIGHLVAVPPEVIAFVPTDHAIVGFDGHFGTRASLRPLSLSS